MMLIDLLRHGETTTPGRLLGRTDPALSATGWGQFARQTADLIERCCRHAHSIVSHARVMTWHPVRDGVVRARLTAPTSAE